VCLQLLVFLLCALIFGCFTYEIAVIKPNWLDILKGLLPKPSVHPKTPLCPCQSHAGSTIPCTFKVVQMYTDTHAELHTVAHRLQILTNQGQLYNAIGILGATCEGYPNNWA
jgi:Mn2+/Fe2+ NRAMP family transporter